MHAAGTPRPGLALATFHQQLHDDLEGVIARVAAMGFEGVEPTLIGGKRVNPAVQGWADRLPQVDTRRLKELLDDHGLVVTSAHTLLPTPDDVEAMLDEQAMLGNDLLIVPAPFVLDGFGFDTFADGDAVARLADRFNEAAALAAPRGVRVGFHNHQWEWQADFDGRSGFDLFFSLVDPSVFAQVDVYWAEVAGRDPGSVVAGLGERALLLHVKDGPLEPLPAPQVALGDGQADLHGALAAGTGVRWTLVEIDACESDTFEAAERSLRFLRENGYVTTAAAAAS